MLILAIAKIGSSLFELPTGVFSDYVGRRKTMLSGQVANIAVHCRVCRRAVLRDARDRCGAGGFLLPLFSGNQDAFLYDTLKDEEPRDGVSRISGPPERDVPVGAGGVRARVGDRAASGFHSASLFWLSLAPQAIGLFIGFFTVEPPRHGRDIETNVLAHLRDAWRRFRPDVKLRDLSIAAMLAFALGESKHMFFPAYFATLWSSSGFGVASMLTHAFAVLGFRASGGVIQRFRELPVLLWTSISSILIGVGATATATVASPAISSLASFAYGPGVVAQRHADAAARSPIASARRWAR